MATERSPLEVSCPTCRRRFDWHGNPEWRPFCSERCRLIDLGEWLGEGHRIPGEPVLDAPVDESGDI